MINTAMVNNPDVFTKNEREYIAPPAAEVQPVSCCHHYWLIDRANGPVSHAVCKYCNEERNFSNLPLHADEMGTDGTPVKPGARTRSFSPYEFFGGKPHQPFAGRKETANRSN